MKKIEYIEQVKYNLETIGETRRYSKMLISTIISRLYDDYMYRLVDKRDSLDQYVTEYEKTVQETSDGDYYVDLDVAPIPLKRNFGIYYVATKGYNGVMGDRLAPINSIELDVFYSLGVGRFDEKGTYYLRDKRLYLQMYGDLSYIKTIRVGLIKQFNDYSDLDEVYMPKQAADAIISSAIEKLSTKPRYDDLINDNSDNINVNEAS